MSIDCVNDLLEKYAKIDQERLEKTKIFLDKKENWDKSIDEKEDINLTLLLVYEYATAAEKITCGKVNFDDMLEKLYKDIDKFRLGELKQSDEDVLYGKTFDDKNAYQVKSLKYDRNIRKTLGASHFMYFDKDKNLKTTVAIFGKKKLPPNEKGEIEITNGCDFFNLSDIRQTVFHEWTHQMEQVFIDENNNDLLYEYIDIHGKKYRNYDKVTQCRILNEGELSEIISLPLEKQFMLSTGISTKEIVEPCEEHPDGIVMHNQITEGIVELIAREMAKSVGVPENQIDNLKYYEAVEIVKRIVTSRDDAKGKGQTYTDFLTDSTILKKELESVQIEGKDGLHYIADYAERAHYGKTLKKEFLSKMPDVVRKLNLSQEKVEKLKNSDVWGHCELSDEDISFLKNGLLQGNEQNKDLNTFVTNKINEYSSILKQEKDFFDGILDKLGYRQKEEKNNNLLNNAVEATKVSTKIGTIAIMENSIEKQMNEQNLEVKNV